MTRGYPGMGWDTALSWGGQAHNMAAVGLDCPDAQPQLAVLGHCAPQHIPSGCGWCLAPLHYHAGTPLTQRLDPPACPTPGATPEPYSPEIPYIYLHPPRCMPMPDRNITLCDKRVGGTLNVLEVSVSVT